MQNIGLPRQLIFSADKADEKCKLAYRSQACAESYQLSNTVRSTYGKFQNPKSLQTVKNFQKKNKNKKFQSVN